jgi:NAD(P)-dependent dehydrogenase (short-subunit alcohol dehydrogenase family)
MSQFELTDKVAIITGGGTGIGRTIALEFAKAGANVVVASRKQANLDGTVEELKALGKPSLAVATDIRVPEQVDDLVKQTLDRYGRVDILVNNAGASFMSPVEEMTPNGWDTIININLKGTFLCCRAAGKVMIEQKSGKIINVASTAGVNGSPRMAHYGAAKAGVINFTKSLATEWAQHNINVNCITPGLIETEGVKTQMNLDPQAIEEQKKLPLLRRPGQTEDIAFTAIFLASEASKFLTGENIVVRGNQ